METQTIANILLAAAIAHSLHSVMEPRNIREKVKRLVAYMDKKPYKEIPLKIDSRAKGIGLGYSVALVTFVIAYLIVSLIDPSVRTSMIVTIGLLVLVELLNTVTIDAYHAEIEVVTRRFKKTG